MQRKCLDLCAVLVVCNLIATEHLLVSLKNMTATFFKLISLLDKHKAEHHCDSFTTSSFFFFFFFSLQIKRLLTSWKHSTPNDFFLYILQNLGPSMNIMGIIILLYFK